MMREARWLWMLVALCATAGCASVAHHLPAARQARIAFVSADGLSDDRAQALLAAAMSRRPTAVWCHGMTPGEPSAGQGWRNVVGPADSAAIGPVIVIAVPDPAPAGPGSEGWGPLIESLSLTEARWKVVLVERGPLLPGVDRERLALEDLFERAGVAMVISVGPAGYLRSAPVGSRTGRLTRHVVLSSIAGEATAGTAVRASSDAIADVASGVRLAFLDASPTELTWSAYSDDGTLLDAVTLRVGETQAAFLTMQEVLAGERNVHSRSGEVAPQGEHEQ